MTVRHLGGRESILRALRCELVGPDPRGPELDFSVPVKFDVAADAYGPWRQMGSGEEVLQDGLPTQRYGVGVLYAAQDAPPEETEPLQTPAAPEGSGEGGPDLIGSEARRRMEIQVERVAAAAAAGAESEPTDDFDIAGANDYRPTTMAVSFLVDVSSKPSVIVEGQGGRYTPQGVLVGGRERTWWLRSGVNLKAEFGAASILVKRSQSVEPTNPAIVENAGPLDLKVFCVARPYSQSSALLTIGLVNRSKSKSDETAMFQSGFSVRVCDSHGRGAVLPYPEARIVDQDEEEMSLELLYRNYQTFAIGHGCAADWDQPTFAGTAQSVSVVRAECLPAYQTPSITADIRRADGSTLTVPMAPLAGLIAGEDGLSDLQNIIVGYRDWIKSQDDRVGRLEIEFQPAAKRHVDECRNMLARMQSGLLYLQSDNTAAKAFKLANHAVLLQQIRAGSGERKLVYDKTSKRLVLSQERIVPDPLVPPPGRGSWRPFQIAFLLAAIESTADPGHEDRELVDLIFFPTGGGKTEAYLGLSAFSIFLRRLRNPDDTGTQILMRYTLRLLTSQQFQRASALICAMEIIRRSSSSDLGAEPFGIGIWVGGDTTPNRCSQARDVLRDLRSGDKWAENKFVVIRCPWCAAQIGPIRYEGRTPKGAPVLAGYEWSPTSCITIHCTDPNCEFASALPVLVVDEQIYEKRPDLVIGTVDKFARLAWDDRTRALFGIDDSGEQFCSPPGLIIQDELHLISGPLGSMVGLYEAVIEDLCTDFRLEPITRPKIVSSTATIRRYEDQARSLFARTRTALFPPRGTEISDSYFAQYALEEDGNLSPGRLHVGVHGSGLGSMQTAEVRTFSALLQGARSIPDVADRDPWWTLLAFFNSLRELGTSLSLLQSDIPDYLKTMKRREGIEWSEVRRLNETLELTGRLRSNEVPEAIRALEVTTTEDAYPVDVCLASNIIEVGVDIDRLSLLTIVGQPKTTAQYIQVSGRVGRRWWERPGLVVTIYGASKPRDRSHFEKFRSYHERLYAQVEPTSVTPFSPPVLDRAAHAVLISYVRQRGNRLDIASPYPMPDGLLADARRLLEERLEIVDSDERETFKRVMSRRMSEWSQWQRTSWEQRPDDDSFLIRQYGSYVADRFRNTTWQVPTSLRNVDAECEAVITSQYAVEAADGGASSNGNA